MSRRPIIINNSAIVNAPPPPRPPAITAHSSYALGMYNPTSASQQDEEQENEIDVSAYNALMGVPIGENQIKGKFVNMWPGGGRTQIACFIYCVGPITGFSGLLLGDERCYSKRWDFNGDPRQNILDDPEFADVLARIRNTEPDFADNYTTNFYPGVPIGFAGHFIELDVDENVYATPYAHVLGRPLFNPDSRVVEYSRNPLDALIWYWTSPYPLGCNMPLDYTGIAAIRQDIEGTVNGKPRRTFDMVLESQSSPMDWLATLENAAGVRIIPYENTFRIINEFPPEPITYLTTLTEDDFIDFPPVVEKTTDSETPNAVQVVYTDKNTTDRWRTLPSSEVRLSGVNTGELPYQKLKTTMTWIDNEAEANRAAAQIINSENLQDLRVTARVGAWGKQYHMGDLVRLTMPSYGITDKPMRFALPPSMVSTDRYDITLLEFDPAIRSDEAVDEPTFPDTSLQDPAVVPPLVNIQWEERIYQRATGEHSSKLHITWELPENWPYAETVYVDASFLGQPLADRIGIKATALRWVSPDLMEIVRGVLGSDLGTARRGYATLQLYSIVGAEGTLEPVPFLIQGNLIPPPNIVDFDAFESGGMVTLTWTQVGDIGDNMRYAIRYAVGTSPDQTWAGNAASEIIETGNRAQIPFLSAGSYLFMIKAVDSDNNYSETEAIIRVVVEIDTPSFGAQLFIIRQAKIVDSMTWRDAAGNVCIARVDLTAPENRLSALWPQMQAQSDKPMYQLFRQVPGAIHETSPIELASSGLQRIEWNYPAKTDGDIVLITELAGVQTEHAGASGSVLVEFDKIFVRVTNFSYLRACEDGSHRIRVLKRIYGEDLVGLSSPSGPEVVTLDGVYTALAFGTQITPLPQPVGVNPAPVVSYHTVEFDLESIPNTITIDFFDATGTRVETHYSIVFRGYRN